MRFCDIKGLEEVKGKLINSVKKDHLAHAILLSGRCWIAKFAFGSGIFNLLELFE